MGIVDAMIFISSKVVGELIDSTKLPPARSRVYSATPSKLKLQQDHLLHNFRFMLPLYVVRTCAFKSKSIMKSW
jgi:hypothetical protein